MSTMVHTAEHALTQEEQIKHASYYLEEKKFSVLPVDTDKKALFQWKEFQKRKPTTNEIREWWSRYRSANIALVTGSISNLTVVDCDSEEAIKIVEDHLPKDFEMPMVFTPRGGRHFYFRYCSELSSRNGAVAKVDIKNDGGYILCPPSQTDKGSYAWHSTLNLETIPEIPTMPAGLLEFFLKSYYAAPQHSISAARPLTEGRRDDDLFHTAFQLFKDGGQRQDVQRIILNLAKVCTPPFLEKEAIAKVDSAQKRAQQSPGKSLLPARSLVLKETRFSECKPESVKWLMQDRIPMGMVSVILGHPGEGKTFLAIEIASRISKGEPLPGSARGLVRGSTAFISAENSLKYVLSPRAIACNADLDKLIHCPVIVDLGDLESEKAILFDITQHMPILEKSVRENRDIKLVIVDPIISHMGAKTETKNDLQVRQVMDALSEFANKTGTAVIVIMHMNKSQSLEAISRTAGSHQFMAGTKAAWLVAKDPNDPEGNRRVMVPIKSNLSANRKSLFFKLHPVSILESNPDEKIETACVVFDEEEGDIDATEFLNPDRRVEESKTSRAIRFLNETLRTGPMPDSDIERIAKEAGINLNTFRLARKRRGIKAYKTGMSGKWQLCLPEQWDASKDSKS
jgi:putative DNA primase/helicase